MIGEVALAYLRRGGFCAGNWDALAYMHAAQPAAFRVADASFFHALDSSWYYFGPRVLGRVVAAAGLGAHAAGALAAVQAVLWGLQIIMYGAIAGKVCASRAAARLSTSLFAWGTPLLYLVDVPFGPDVSIGRNLGLTFGLASLLAWTRGGGAAPWIIAALGMYAHPGPCAVILLYYFLTEILLDWEETVARCLICATILIPIIAAQLGPGLPEPWNTQAALGYGPALFTYGWASWTCFTVGAAIVALGALCDRRPAMAVRVKLMLLAGVALFLVRFGVRLLPGAPRVLLGITAGFQGLAVVQYLGLPLAADFVLSSAPALPRAAALLYCLFGPWAASQRPLALEIPRPEWRAPARSPAVEAQLAADAGAGALQYLGGR